MALSRERGFRVLADLATPEIGAYLRRRLYPLAASELDDLVAEVLLVAWRRYDDIPSDAQIPWLIGVARNVLRNAVRKQQRTSILEARWRRPITDSSAEDNFIADESVRVALTALTADDREVLLLHAWDGCNAEQIGIILGISSNAAAVRLSRVKGRFQQSLSEASLS